jgi:hypothetical protein
MLRFIAIVAGLLFAAKALKSREGVADETPLTRFSEGPSEEEVEQEIRAKV